MSALGTNTVLRISCTCGQTAASVPQAVLSEAEIHALEQQWTDLHRATCADGPITLERL
jgi:hypothetical protein